MAVHALIFNVYTSVFLFIEPVEFDEVLIIRVEIEAFEIKKTTLKKKCGSKNYKGVKD